MGVFKAAHEYDSLESFMNDRYDLYFNKSHVGISKADLTEWLVELNVSYKKSATRDELFKLLFEQGITVVDCYERFPRFYAVTKNDYVQRFNITDSEYNRLKRTNFLKEVSRIESSSRYGMVGYDAKQFFEMTEEELRSAIPPGDKERSEKARLARIKGLTCVRCGEVQNHYSRISKEKLCRDCQYAVQCEEFLNSDKYLILDTETTGLDWNDEIIELAILDTKGNVLYESMFKPNQEIPREATSIHGITDDMVKDCPNFASEWEKIWTIIKDKTLLIYNDNFDTSMLYRTLEQHEIVLEDDFRFNSFCIMKFYQNYQQDRRWTSLSNACWEMDVKIKQDHRALGDCQMVLELIKAIANKH